MVNQPISRAVIVTACAITLASCAKRPDAISPAAIPIQAYQGQSCEQLASTLATERQTLARISDAQNNAATGDAIGVFLVGVPVSSVSGGDQEGNIAVSKGKIQAIEAVRSQKGC